MKKMKVKCLNKYEKRTLKGSTCFVLTLVGNDGVVFDATYFRRTLPIKLIVSRRNKIEDRINANMEFLVDIALRKAETHSPNTFKVYNEIVSMTYLDGTTDHTRRQAAREYAANNPLTPAELLSEFEEVFKE